MNRTTFLKSIGGAAVASVVLAPPLAAAMDAMSPLSAVIASIC